MPANDRYKWIALSNTTLAVLLATLDSSILLIAMPDIFRGIGLDPLAPGNSFYLLWMILGFLIVTSVLVVSVGRLGDMFGRVRMYNLGFVIYTARLAAPDDRLDARPRGGRLADRLPDRPGDRGRVPDRELRGDPDRRVPLDPARARARDQQRRRDQRAVHRARARRAPRADRLAARLPRLGAARDLRDDLVVQDAARHRRPQARAVRLGRQPHLRARPDPGDDRDHARDPALRRASDGLDLAVRARHDRRRARAARRVRRDRAAHARSRCSGSRCSGSAPTPSACSRASSRRSPAAG